EPPIAPRGHRGEDRVHVAALVGQAVLVARRTRLVLEAGQQPFVDETREPLAEDVAPDPERGPEVVEAAGAEARLPDQQQIPVVAQQVGAARDRARPRRGVGAFHADTVSQWVASWYPLAYGSLMQTEAAASWKQTACIL